MVDIGFTIKILIIVIIAFLVITAWDEVLDRTLIKYFNMDKEAISTWVTIAVISTVALFIIIVYTNIEAHDLFGISETVDTQLTGKAERIRKGKVVHYNSP